MAEWLQTAAWHVDNMSLVWTKSHSMSGFFFNPQNSFRVCVDVAGLQQLTSLLARLLNTQGARRQQTGETSSEGDVSKGKPAGLHPWRDALPCRWYCRRCQVLLRLHLASSTPSCFARFYQDVTVAHKPTPARREGEGSKMPLDILQSKKTLLVYFWIERPGGVGRLPRSQPVVPKRRTRTELHCVCLCTTAVPVPLHLFRHSTQNNNTSRPVSFQDKSFF